MLQEGFLLAQALKLHFSFNYLQFFFLSINSNCKLHSLYLSTLFLFYLQKIFRDHKLSIYYFCWCQLGYFFFYYLI